MTTRYKNLKLTSVNYGFGWRYDGDMSTHPIGNILEDLDYKFGTLTNNCIKFQNENNELKSIIEYLLTMETHDYDSLAIKQDAKEMYENYVTNSTQKDKVCAESNTGEE